MNHGAKMLFFIRVSKFGLNVAQGRPWRKKNGIRVTCKYIFAESLSGLANYIKQFQSRDHLPGQIASWVITRENERKR